MHADLHIHTTYSDGSDTPREIFKLAEKNDIKTIAITDHDSVGGVRIAQGLSSEYEVNLVSGIEILTHYEGQIAHILGYYIDINSPDLAIFLRDSAISKTENTRVNFENVKNILNLNYTWDKVLKNLLGYDMITGSHVINSMDKDRYKIPGFIDNNEVFFKYFQVTSKYHIDTEIRTPFDAIDIIKKAGGIPIIAHPGIVNSDSNIEKFIKHGAAGLEVYHPYHMPEQTKKYLEYCTERGLYITGGSGWQGKYNSCNENAFGMYGLSSKDYDILTLRD